MAKHTPGPWEAVEVNEEIPLPAGVLIAVHKAGDYSKQGCVCDIRAQGDGKYEPEVTNANAHLISASPEMYDALKEVLAEASSPSFDDERLAYVEVQMSKRTLEDIRKAVAKAEGRREE